VSLKATLIRQLIASEKKRGEVIISYNYAKHAMLKLPLSDCTYTHIQIQLPFLNFDL
jgi:hypothetical protein